MATIIRGRFRRHRRSRSGATVAARVLLSAILALAAHGAPAPLRASTLRWKWFRKFSRRYKKSSRTR